MSEIEEVVEEAAKNNIVLTCVVAGTVGALVGYYIGYKTSMKILEPKYAARTEEEVKETKAFYAALHKQGEYSTPEGAAEALSKDPEGIALVEAATALTNYQGGTFEGPHIHEESVVVDEIQNVFEANPEFVWDDTVEKAKRAVMKPADPYVISEDEWDEHPPGQSLVTVTYYQGDNVLADEKDEAIPDLDNTIGEECLSRFGHGTQDSRTVFVRNNRMQIDFEVLLHDGNYAHEVLGFQHGEFLAQKDHKPPLRRFRQE